MIHIVYLRDAERVARIIMIVVLTTAGLSKFASGGGFVDYYSGAFQGDLRIVLPAPLINAYLTVIPFIELGLAGALAVHAIRRLAVYGWIAFMLSLMIGHYILQEWSAVNDILDYLFLGLLCLVLPAHPGWLTRDAAPVSQDIAQDN